MVDGTFTLYVTEDMGKDEVADSLTFEIPLKLRSDFNPEIWVISCSLDRMRWIEWRTEPE